MASPTAPGQGLLEVRDLTAGYGAVQALRGVELEVEAGSIVTIIGANGAGKSTLLKSISGQIRGKSGRIVFQGRDITNVQPEKIVDLGVSQVPEGRQIFASLSVEDNLLLGGYLSQIRGQRRAVVEARQEVFAIFPVLENRRRQLAGTLSGGEQQMLAIGRALMARPKLLLLDEPSMGLAPLIVREIFRVLEDLNAAGTTILLVEQNARAALNTARYGYVLETGRVAVKGPSADLLANNDIKEAYLGGAPGGRPRRTDDDR
jgi:branched-chain amino acid transport system ATP-binding protein